MKSSRFFSAALLLLGACEHPRAASVGSSERADALPAASGARPRDPAEVAAPGMAAASTTASPAASTTVLPPWAPPSPPGASSDFCIDAVSVLDESTCYVLPAAPTAELLIYLHGIVPPAKTSRQKTNFETVVANASRRAGVAALMPRGRVGLSPAGHERWWGWPTSRDAHLRLAPELVAEFAEKRSKLEALTGRRFERLYLAGSSSGAYFAVALALDGDMAADGFAVISGGADRPGAVLSRLTPTPFYIGYGSSDTVGAGARALAARLRKGGFPVQLAVHPLPHGTAEVYLDEAFSHFRQNQARR